MSSPTVMLLATPRPPDNTRHPVETELESVVIEIVAFPAKLF